MVPQLVGKISIIFHQVTSSNTFFLHFNKEKTVLKFYCEQKEDIITWI